MKQKEVNQVTKKLVGTGRLIAINFSFEDHGSICSICPLTKRAHVWMQKNLQTEGWQWIGKTLNVDHRMFFGVQEFIYENFI